MCISFPEKEKHQEVNYCNLYYQSFSEPESFKDEHPLNIYFVKEASQVWPARDFCYIEATARRQPSLDVY